MKITFLDFDDIQNPLLNAGQARATYEVGRRLVEKGHQVLVISAKYPGYQDRIQDGINYQHISLGSQNIRLNNIFYILSIPFIVKRLKTDILLECFTAPISTLMSPLWTKLPVVAIPTSFEAERFSRLYKFPFHLIERFGCRFYKYFLPYTEDINLKMKKINKHIISKIVPEGVDEQYFQIKKKSPRYILFLGRLDFDQKGIDLLLQAYARIVDKIKYPLIIAGNGPDENKVKTLINNLNLSNKVKMIGPTYGDKKEKILQEAIAVAFPSRHEGFSLFSLEALASGLPLIAFDMPGLSWTNKNVALKAKAFDTKSYAALLLEVNNLTLMQKMSSSAREFAKKYSWDKVTNQFEQFFYQIKTWEKYAN